MVVADSTKCAYGLTLTLHSGTSALVFLQNKPSALMNLLHTPFNLDQHKNYEGCFSNVHIPAFLKICFVDQTKGEQY